VSIIAAVPLSIVVAVLRCNTHAFPRCAINNNSSEKINIVVLVKKAIFINTVIL